MAERKSWTTSSYASKDHVLNRLAEIDIFNWYLGIHVSEKSVFSNPLRTDRDPSCNFFRGGDGRLRLIDHSGWFKGDCFDLVMKMNGCTYKQAIQIIWNDFTAGTRSVKFTPEHFAKQAVYKERATILIKKLPWNSTTLEYWRRFHIGQETLEKFDVHPLAKVWVGKNTYKQNEVAEWSNSNPVFGYRFAKGQWKIYQPLVKTGYRFIGNTNILQGLQQLQKSSYLVITKSLKDVMVLDLFEIPAVAPHSEGIIMKDIDKMLHYYEAVFVFFDNDWPGRKSTLKYAREGCIPLLLKEKKDISDYLRDFGMEQTKQLIDEAKRSFGLGD
jgi:hypothetical protein